MPMCPQCRKSLTAADSPFGATPTCEGCGHVWVTADALEQFQEAATRQYAPEDVRVLQAECEARKKAALQREVVYHRCPGCENQLLRRTFGELSFILVHYCVAHGYWIHRDELDAIVDYIESGGEILEMRHVIDNLEEEQLQLESDNRDLEKKAKAAAAIVPMMFFRF